MLKVYTAIVRPHLEYQPHLRKNAELLENVQKQALKICNKQWDLGYQALLDISQLPSLANRRTHFKLCTLFKIVNGLLDFPPNVIIPTACRSRNNSPQSLLCPYAHTTAFQRSFVPSSINLWNNLPIEALSSTTLNSFTLPLFM